MICKKGEWTPLVKKKNKKGRISSPPCEDNPSLPAGSCSADAGHCHQNTEDGARMERDCAGTCGQILQGIHGYYIGNIFYFRYL